MDKLIRDRLSIIVAVVLGSGTGWSLSGFIEVAEIKQWLTGIAIAFSLMISFIISINYQSSHTKLHKKRYRTYAGICTILFLVMMSAFFISYNNLATSQTVNVDMGDNTYRTVKDSVFIKGLYFTPEMRNEIAQIKKANRFVSIDEKTLFQSTNNNINEVWDTTSRTLAKLLILFCYSFFIASFTVLITISTEIYQDKNKKSSTVPAT